MINNFNTPLASFGSKTLALVLLTIALLSASAPLQVQAEDKATYILGVFPHLPPRDLEKVFAPIAADLGKAFSGNVELRTSTTYAKFTANLEAELYDIAFVQPFDYIRAAKKSGYLPMATRKEKLAVIVVTKMDSTIKSLSDLRGKKVALPPKTSAVSQLLNGHLRSNGIHPKKDMQLVYQRSHISCMRKVLIGDVDACGTAAPARRFFQSKFGVEFRVVSKSREIPHTPWIIHPRINKKNRKAIRDQILNWGNTKDGRQLLSRGKLTPFVPIKDSAYNVVRKLAGK